MKCTCKTDIEAKLLERLKGETPTGSDHAVSLSNYGMVLVENTLTTRPYTVANTSVTMPKKGGGFTQKRATMNMFFSVCPYCGQPVTGDSATKDKWIPVETSLPDSEPGAPEVEFFSPDLRNPTTRWIGMFREGKWFSCGVEVFNVTHWRHLSDNPQGPWSEEMEGGAA